MRISDWSSDVCSSDLRSPAPAHARDRDRCRQLRLRPYERHRPGGRGRAGARRGFLLPRRARLPLRSAAGGGAAGAGGRPARKSVVSGKSVSVRLVLGWWRTLKKNTSTTSSKLIKK